MARLTEKEIRLAMAHMGRKGGLARTAALTPERRSAIARLGAYAAAAAKRANRATKKSLDKN